MPCGLSEGPYPHPFLGPAAAEERASEEGEERLDIPLLVQDVCGEQKIEDATVRVEARRFVPAHRHRRDPSAVSPGISLGERERVVRPVGRDDVSSGERRDDRRQPEPAAELEYPPATQVA